MGAALVTQHRSFRRESASLDPSGLQLGAGELAQLSGGHVSLAWVRRNGLGSETVHVHGAIQAKNTFLLLPDCFPASMLLSKLPKRLTGTCE